MTLHGVHRWLRGETLPAQDKLIALAEWLRIPPDELRYGAEIKSEIQQVRQRWDEAINHYERETFEAYLSLPDLPPKTLPTDSEKSPFKNHLICLSFCA